MAIKPNREYRVFNSKIEVREFENEEKSFIVEGYATTFDDPYVMFSCDGVDYYEKVDARAFDEADMTDVIFLLNHEGMVYARLKNGTLSLSVDEHGLFVRADLGSTEASREIYEAIKTGLICEMSFAFVVEEDSYNNDTHCRTILKIKKVYDVSAVSIPANPNTDISARSYFEGVIEKEHQELMEAEKRNRQKQRIKILLEEF